MTARAWRCVGCGLTRQTESTLPRGWLRLKRSEFSDVKGREVVVTRATACSEGCMIEWLEDERAHELRSVR